MRDLSIENKQGEMGVSTLIIIISFILVAAVVANVLINTSNIMGEQTEKTYDDTLKNTGSRYFVKDITGRNEGTDNNLETIYLKVGIPACSSPQNLKQTIIEIDDSSIEANLNYSEGAATGEHYNASVMIDPEGDFSQSTPVLNPGTLVKITIDADTIGLDLTPQSQITINIIPKHGSVKTEEITTPAVQDSELVPLN